MPMPNPHFDPSLNGYIAFFQGRRIEIRSATLHEAHLAAIAQLKVPKSKLGLLSVILAEKGGKPVVHTPDF